MIPCYSDGIDRFYGHSTNDLDPRGLVGIARRLGLGLGHDRRPLRVRLQRLHPLRKHLFLQRLSRPVRGRSLKGDRTMNLIERLAAAQWYHECRAFGAEEYTPEARPTELPDTLTEDYKRQLRDHARDLVQVVAEALSDETATRVARKQHHISIIADIRKRESDLHRNKADELISALMAVSRETP